jgi:hypothetical protein
VERIHEGEFLSPCARLSVANLSGITFERLQDTLGPPGLCDQGGSYDNVPKPGVRPVPFVYECRWGFYRLEGLGGGPELQCLTEDRVTCQRVRWVQTQ